MKNKNRFLSLFTDEWQLKIAALVGAVFTWFFYDMISLEERYLTVPLEVSINETVAPLRSYPEAVKLTVRGRAEDIYLFSDEDFRAFADFSAHDVPGRYAVPISVQSLRSAELLNDIQIDTDPKFLDLAFDWKVTKQVEVTADLKGFPASGFEVAEVRVEPAFVEISAPESVAALIETVSTIPIPIDGSRNSFSVLAEVALDDKTVSFTGEPIVRLYVTVSEVTGDPIVRLYVTVSEVYVEKNFEPLPIELNHSLSGGTLSITPQTGSLSLSGRQLLMDGLSAADVSLKVDLPELVPGESVELPVVPSVPEGTTVLQQTPQTVTVTYNGEEN